MKRSVVIGAGPAGIAAAITLCRSGRRSVMLIDAGPDRRLGHRRTPGLTRSTAVPIRWFLRGDPTRASYLSGRGLGGAALVNAWLLGPDRGPIEDLDSRPVPLGPVGVALGAGLGTTTRVRSIDPSRDGSVAGAFGLTSDVRHTIDVCTSTSAYRILTDRDRIVGVATDHGTVDADEVFVAAGAVASPLLLLDSGISADGLGDGLSDHPALAITASVSGLGGGVPAGEFGHAGVVISAVASIGVPEPALEIGQSASGQSASGQSASGQSASGLVYAVERLDVESGAMRRGLILALLNGERSGRVTRCATTGAPVVDLGPFTDTDRFVALLDQLTPLFEDTSLAELLAGAAIDEWGTPPRALDSPGAAAAIETAIGGLYHAAGTCSRAVEQGGAVLGYRGLYVADVSQLARAPSWPMQASIACGRASATSALTAG